MKSLLAFILVACFFVGCTPVVDPSPSTGVTETPQSNQETKNTQPTETVDTSESGQYIGDTEPTESMPVLHEASVFRFLEETNHSGKYLPYNKLVPPGTPHEIWQIPKASQTYVGQTVSIILAKEAQPVSLYYSCSESGTERLAVFIWGEKIPMLMIFEPKLGGIKGLYQHIQDKKVFQGKVLAVVNVDNVEGTFQVSSVCRRDDGVLEYEIVNGDTTLTVGECVGIVETDGTAFLKGGQYATASARLRDNIDWMKGKFKRFSLENIIP